MSRAGALGDDDPPLWRRKRHDEPSVFLPESLLREARRQRRLPDVGVPEVCVLDPDGDIVAGLVSAARSRPHEGWACYHTTLHTFDLGEREVGVVGRAVGAPFAVLVAEQLAASGCRLIVSLTSAGQVGHGRPPYYVVIDRAWRDEGTSLHYRPPAAWSHLRPRLAGRLTSASAFEGLPQRVVVGSTWTTDAPFRETASALSAAEAEGIVAVEMEAAALYAFSETRGTDVVCLAHVTNTMAVHGDDFDKGADDGVESSLAVVQAVVERVLGAGCRDSYGYSL